MLTQLAQRGGSVVSDPPPRDPQAGRTLQLNLSEGTHTFKTLSSFDTEADSAALVFHTPL